MLEDLKKQVCEANLKLLAEGLVVNTFGNVSGIDRDSGNVVIKPSGVPYEQMKPRDMVVVELSGAERVEGDLQPSSDLQTHLELYRAFRGIGGIAHSHSTYATSWAQARKDIPVLGTTHADYFHGPVPCTRPMTADEVLADYERNTAKAIVERMVSMDPMRIPAVLVANHGPFTWGQDPLEAAANSTVLEHLAILAAHTVSIEPYPKPISRELLDKHYSRKHGPGAYYGQK